MESTLIISKSNTEDKNISLKIYANEKMFDFFFGVDRKNRPRYHFVHCKCPRKMFVCVEEVIRPSQQFISYTAQHGGSRF